MRTRTYWIPAASFADARVVAHAVHHGNAPLMPWHLSEEACQTRCDQCNEMLGARPLKPIGCLAEVRAVDDGRIVNVWPLDRIGKVAASAAFLYAGCWLVGLATLL